MDECMLNDLLECSVCLERLDTSSKVLPCQHTFCKKCLEEIVSTKKELRCPECRVLVECKVGELPPNVLLMRILEGMRNAGPKKRTSVPNRVGLQTVCSTLPAHPVVQPQSVQLLQHAAAVSPPEITRAHCAPKQTLLPNQPYARAIYDYLSNEQGDLKFKKGDIILLRKKMDVNWYHGESGGKQGVFPLSYVQVITPLPSHIPQCKALYDFRMTNDDEEGCLTFNKGEVINVIRRVDENWAEGKLTDRIGIFPLAFVELNNVARALMKLSSNSQPGPSRLAPPTPTSEDMTPLIPTDHSRTVATAQTPIGSAVHNTSHHHITMGVSQDSSSTVSSSSSSSTTPNTPSSNTSSSSSTAPSSPASPPPRPLQPSQNTTSPPPRPAYNPTLSPPRVVQNVVGTQASQSAQNRGKRHSFSSVLHTGQHQQTSHRHSAEILTPSEPSPSDGPTAEQSPQSLGSEVNSQRHHRRSGSTDMTGCPPPGPHQGLYQNVQLPAPYIALYPYKPQKADEMELRKGAIYMVTERCQDGWFKGTSNRTQKGGVFPGNYVAPTKQVSGNSQLRGGLSRQSTSPSCSLQSSPRSNGTTSDPTQAAGFQRTRQQTGSPAYSPRQQSSQPPELPPRSSSPQVSPSVNNTHHASPISTSWHGQPQEAAAQTPVPLGRSQSAVMPSGTSPNTAHAAASVVPPPNVAICVRSTEKVKERKEKSGVSLMRRLTSIKKSKSPPPLTSYSMDNPVFEDGSVSLTPSHPVHVRSGSCPSQLLQVLPLDGTTAHHRLFGSGSQRLKHKSERPHVVTVNATYFARAGETTAASGAVSVNQHRKSNSLDAGSGDSARKAGKPAAPPVRERFRCIVPYPPNSEYELELRVGDIIYVHKKRDDGWYKGTQQRTGRTGLFPASFVETF